MRNAFIFLLFVAAIWVGVEVMNHGMAGAFNGVFVELGLADPDDGPEGTPMGRAGQRFDEAYRASEERASRHAP